MSMELRLAPSPTRGLRTRLGVRDSVNGWSILQRNTGKLKVTSARVNRGKGFMHIVTFVFECVHNDALDLSAKILSNQHNYSLCYYFGAHDASRHDKN